VLDYPEQLQLLDQPLITVSWAKHPHAKVAWSDFDGRYLFAHLLRKVPTADGCFRLFAADELADLLARCKKDLVAFSSMALPLVQVADRQTLKEKVVDPLLGELRK
jgi:hypothetical protein